MGDTRNSFILLGYTLVRIHHNEAHIGSLHRHMGAEHRVALNLIINLGGAADTCGINETEFAPLIFHIGVNGISCGAGNVGDNEALTAYHTVDDGGLACIGFPNDSHTDDIFILVLIYRGREFVHNGV